jgi:hypothetical protein
LTLSLSGLIWRKALSEWLEHSDKGVRRSKLFREEAVNANLFGGRETRPVVVFWAVVAALVTGCSRNVEPPRPQGPRVAPVVSINAIMVALVDHAGHVLWEVEKDGRAPKNDAQWEEIEHHAIQLTVAGTAVALGGTGKRDAEWTAKPDRKSVV